MKVLVYGINFSPELTGIGKYTGEMVDWMNKEKVDIRVITAPPYYPQWKVSDGYSKVWFSKDKNAIKVYRCPLYVPAKPSTVKRLLHLISFSASSFFLLLSQFKWKPDYIICIAPTLFCVPGAILLRKFTGAKVILHIQDYEVDAMLGLGMAKKGLLTNLAKSFEGWCLKAVNKVSTISISMIENAVNKGVDREKMILFPNWSEVDRFRNIDPEKTKKLFSSLKIDANRKVILYSGNIGEKQGLETVVEVAELMNSFPCTFVIVGEGGGKDKLEKLVYDKNLSNIIFRPLQQYSDLPALLSLADCHLVIQKRGAADAVLPSKLTNILAIGGNAVITAEVDTELGRLCHLYPGIATCVEPESVEALHAGILESLTKNRDNHIARSYARDFLSKEKVLTHFLNGIRD